MAEIEVDNIGKYFGDIKAVDGLSFSARKGDVLGFLGPNGAGKSTTMRMICGFIRPTFGSARVSGHDIVTDSHNARKCFGYLPESAPLYGEMTVWGFLAYAAELRGLRSKSKSQAIDHVIAKTGLEKVVFQDIETLSKGYRRRVGLAQALIHDPEILIMDEPTDGLDPNQKFEVRKLISEMAQNKCIILSTHILEEVEEVCNRIVIISDGKLLLDDTPSNVKHSTELTGAVEITFEQSIASKIEKEVRKCKGVKEIRLAARKGYYVTYQVFPEGDCNLLALLYEQGKSRNWPILDIGLAREHLDDLFRQLTKSSRTN